MLLMSREPFRLVNAFPETYSKLCISCKHFPVVEAHVGLMEHIHHLSYALDTKMDTTDENHMGGMQMEIEIKQSVENDSHVRLSDEVNEHLSVSEGPSSSCHDERLRSRPRLQSTKSFPPYSQCIGGLGEDDEWDSELSSEPINTCQLDTKEVKAEETQGVEKKEDIELTARCARETMKAKWRLRRKERSGGSYDANIDGWERGRWSGKRRVEETRKERKHDEEEREGGLNSQWKHWRGRDSSNEKRRQEDEEEERKLSPITAVETEDKGSGETTPDGKDDDIEELPGTTLQWSSSHPILSKFLHSSSTSSCSSINLSSAESDEVFSEGEDVASKRKTFRKVRHKHR